MKRYLGFSLLVVSGLIVTSIAVAGVKRIQTDRKIVALTFDDGPNPPYTEDLLKVLDDKKARATFFLIGKQIEKHPDLALSILASGHELGGHAYGWDSLAFRKRMHVEQQLDKMDAAFAGIGVSNLVLFRPPNGMLSPGQGRILEERGLKHVSADVLAGDWKKGARAEQIRDAVLKKVRPGSIIVLHDGGGNRSATIEAVPLIIDALRKQGYLFIPVGEMLAYVPNEESRLGDDKGKRKNGDHQN